MKKSNPQLKEDVLQCIKIGMSTKNSIINHVRCQTGTLNKILIALVADGKIKVEKHGQSNKYFLNTEIKYHDPFGLAQPKKSGDTFILPPRRAHQLDGERIAA